MKFKLKTIFILLLCLFKAAFRGQGIAKPGKVEKVVIFQGAKLGDMVCTTPMFRAVKERYPNCRLIIIGDKVNRELLDLNPDVDQYIVWDDERFFDKVSEIRDLSADFAAVTGPSFINLAALYLADVPSIVAPVIESGWSPWETKSYKIIRKFVSTRPHRMGSYAPREYLRLLEVVDIQTSDTKKHLAYSPEALNKVRELLGADNSGGFLVGVSLTAGNKIKEWPEERFAAVARHLQDKHNAKIILIGGPNDRKKIDINCLDLSGKLTIDELKALISQLDLFISVDTGPIYIAEAFGVPTIDIIGPMHEDEQPPVGEKHMLVVPQRSKAAIQIMNARFYDPIEARRQVESVTALDVIRVIDILVEKLK